MNLAWGDTIGDGFKVICPLQTTTYAQVYWVKSVRTGATDFEARVFFPPKNRDYVGGDPDFKAYRRRSIRRLKSRAVLQTMTRDGLVAVIYRTGPISSLKSPDGLEQVEEDVSSKVAKRRVRFDDSKSPTVPREMADAVALPRGTRFGENEHNYPRTHLLLWLKSFIQASDHFCYSLSRTWRIFYSWALQGDLLYCYLALWTFVIGWSWYIGTPLPVVIPSVAISHILINYFYSPD